MLLPTALPTAMSRSPRRLAMMEVARMNIQNLVYRTIEMSNAGRTMTEALPKRFFLYIRNCDSELRLKL